MNIAWQIIILIISVVIHEVAHGYMAYRLGDPTAKLAGRLTLNPVNHLDLFGSFLVPLFLLVTHSPILFGWAKPVPYNPYNLRYQKYGPALVGAAGPLANLFLAIFAAILLRTLLVLGLDAGFIFQLLLSAIYINILLMVFNLLPIPPLDGSKLLFAVAPISEMTKAKLEQYGFILFIIFILLFDRLIYSWANKLIQIILRIFVGEDYLF